MRLHAELRARSLRAAGATPDVANAAARQRFGSRTAWQEAIWDLWSFAVLENAWRDLKFAARLLRGSPGFALVAVLTLALGIGATTAIFSVIDNVLIRPFPYADQHRLVSIVMRDPASRDGNNGMLFQANQFLEYQQRNRIFSGVMGVAINRALWTTGGTPQSVNAPLVTPNTFQFLGVPALLGRFAKSADVKPGAPPVCVMGYSFWQTHFAGSPNVLGKRLILDGVATTVIGVMPPRFVFWSGDVWLPIVLRHGAEDLRRPGSICWPV